jgi:hypothetical protein
MVCKSRVIPIAREAGIGRQNENAISRNPVIMTGQYPIKSLGGIEGVVEKDCLLVFDN